MTSCRSLSFTTIMYKIELRVSPNLPRRGELGDMAAEEDLGLAQLGSQPVVAMLPALLM